jgi:hypothetical protein
MCLSCFLIGYVAHRPALPIDFEQQQVRALGWEHVIGMYGVRQSPSSATHGTQGVARSR